MHFDWIVVQTNIFPALVLRNISQTRAVFDCIELQNKKGIL